MKSYSRYIAALVLLFTGFAAFGQSQEDRDAARRDVFVILDVSGSMKDESKFANVQEYLDREVVNGLLKSGDHFTLVTFGDSAEERFSRPVNSEEDKAVLISEIRRLQPDNNWTDIGMAMEKLAEILEQREETGVRRVILFITDGINIPPPESKYRGVDLSVDERFKTLGEKISRGSWFLYVIGIGGRTAAQDVAELIPGSRLQSTGSDLSGVDVNSQITLLEEEERARTEAEEAARLEAERSAGFTGLLRRLAEGLGLVPGVFLGGIVLLVLFLVFLIFLITRIFKTRELVITDEKETIIRQTAPFGGLTLNSPAAVLPGIGNENNQILRIQRGAFGLTVRIMDTAAIADTSPYKKGGVQPLKGVISLANGRIIRITVR
ncbi:MAG: VWA domain-containing protein [Treponema sp.]|jgi:hypothetical protein|nr:VWA domain-containing protein [Treponema sp.]